MLMSKAVKPPVALLTIGITCIIASITQFKDVRKTYLVSDSDFRFNMVLFFIFFGIGMLLIGIYAGMWIMKARNSGPPRIRSASKKAPSTS